jgi:hypothetical protein
MPSFWWQRQGFDMIASAGLKFEHGRLNYRCFGASRALAFEWDELRGQSRRAHPGHQTF